MQRNVNLRVVAESTGDRLSVAKAVKLNRDLNGEWVIHAVVHRDYSRKSLDAWGVRVPLILFAQGQPIQRVFLYCPEEDRTYWTTLEDLADKGYPGKRDTYGDTVNLRKSEWHSFPGRLPTPFVRDTDENATDCPKGSFGGIKGLEALAGTTGASVAPGTLEPQTQQLGLFE